MNAGMRRTLCPNCNFWIRMSPKAYLLWSLVPLALLVILVGLLYFLAWSFLIFALAIIFIRLMWFLLAPCVVRLEPIGKRKR
jgi:hypothetical protein